MAPEIPVHDVVWGVSPLRLFSEGDLAMEASGFFFKKSDGTLHLVTSAHVFRDPDEGHEPDEVGIHLHRDSWDPRSKGVEKMALYDSSGAALFEAPAAHPDADVSLLPVDEKDLASRFHIRWFSEENFLPNDYWLHPGEDVLVMGYPLGFYDRKHLLPVFRSGMIASTYGMPFNGEPAFLVDAFLHEGTSGSPVLTKPGRLRSIKDNASMVSLSPGTHYYLLGVHSGAIGPTPEDTAILNLNRAWYAEILEGRMPSA